MNNMISKKRDGRKRRPWLDKKQVYSDLQLDTSLDLASGQKPMLETKQG